MMMTAAEVVREASEADGLARTARSRGERCTALDAVADVVVLAVAALTEGGGGARMHRARCGD